VHGTGAALATGAAFAPRVARAALGDLSGTTLIGVVGPFTGDDAHLGEQIQNGAQQACDQANRIRGAYQGTYALRTFNDQNELATAIVNAQFAVDDASVLCVIGHLSGRETDAALQTYARANMAVIVPVSTYDRLTEQGLGNVLRLTTKDSIEGQLVARDLLASLKPKVVVAATADGEYGPDVVNGFLRELQANKVDASVDVLPFDKPNFARAAAAMTAVKPEAVFLAGTVAQLGPMLGALHDAGYAGQVLASQGFFAPATIAKYGALADGLVASTSMPPLVVAPSVYRLKTDYEQKYGPLTPLAAFGYASAQIAIVASQATGASDRVAFLRALTRPNVQYQTIVGDLTFNATGETQNPNIYFYTVTNGAFRYTHAAHPSGFLIK